MAHANYYFSQVKCGIPFADLVEEELASARRSFPRPQASAHEGFAVLMEEIDELWELVKQKQSERVPADMLKELVQIGAMTQRMAEEIVLGDRVNDDFSQGLR